MTNIGQYCSDTGHTIIFYLMWMLPDLMGPTQSPPNHLLITQYHVCIIILVSFYYILPVPLWIVLSAVRCYKSITYHHKEHNSKFQLIEIEETVARPSENLEKFF